MRSWSFAAKKMPGKPGNKGLGGCSEALCRQGGIPAFGEPPAAVAGRPYQSSGPSMLARIRAPGAMLRAKSYFTAPETIAVEEISTTRA